MSYIRMDHAGWVEDSIAAMEAAMITYRRWRAMGEPHEAAVRHVFELIRRIEAASREACR